MESLARKTSEEVEVLKLAENGQNWKIYHTKIVEAAATDIMDLLGVLAGWEPDDGSYDWECQDAILKWTFYTSVPISILRPIRKLDTADQIFKYLAKRFCDSKPIPRANEVQRAGTAAAAETPEKSPTSESAAAETLASTNRDNNEDLSTKALTRGTQDVNNRNVGCTQDLCMSLGASAQGTSAKCAETTPVVLKSVLPHEMQTKLQNSLPLTPRPPIEGEPSGCKQEAAESIVTAGCTNGMVEMAEPTEIADIDGMALLGREPVERARGIGEGDKTEREAQSRLQESKLLCGEKVQRSRIANRDLPSALGLPLVGEWLVCASGKTSDSNAVESEACEGDAAKRGDAPNELTELLTTTVKPYIGDGDTSVRVCLGSMSTRTGNTNRPGSQADALRGQTDAPDVSNNAETNVTDHGESASTYLRVRDAKRVVVKMCGTGTHVDALTGQGEVPSVESDAIKPVNAMEIVSIPRIKEKPPDIPMEITRGHPDEPDGCGNPADTLSVQTDAHSIGEEMETAANEMENVRKRQKEAWIQNSPETIENRTPEHTDQWRQVGIRDASVNVPWNTPLEVLGTTNQMFAFGEVENAGKAIAPIVEGKRDGDGNCGQNRGDGDDERDGDGDGMTSGGSIDST